MVPNLELVLVFYEVGKVEDLVTTTVDRGSRKFGSLEDIYHELVGNKKDRDYLLLTNS